MVLQAPQLPSLPPFKPFIRSTSYNFGKKPPTKFPFVEGLKVYIGATVPGLSEELNKRWIAGEQVPTPIHNVWHLHYFELGDHPSINLVRKLASDIPEEVLDLYRGTWQLRIAMNRPYVGLKVLDTKQVWEEFWRNKQPRLLN